MDPLLYIEAALALVFVLGLIGLAGLLVRRVGAGGRMLPSPGGRKRLSAVEIAPVDAKRRLVLLRRDDTEHLVLLGPQHDVVIETGIDPPNEARSAAVESAPPAGGFSQLLQRFRQRSRTGDDEMAD